MPAAVRACLLVLGGWVAACELKGVGLSFLPVGPVKWLHLAVMTVAAGLVLARAVTRREERAAWMLLGLGVCSWIAGELYFTLVLWDDAAPPIPSPADFGYLAMPPLVFAGLVVLARQRVRGLPRTLWVDGVTAGLAAGAVSAAVVFEPILSAVGGDSFAVATNLSYPIADLLLLGLICGLLAAGGRRLDRRFGILAAGVLCFWTSDTIYLVKAAQGTWSSGGPYDPGWWTIGIALAAAAWTDPRGRAAAIRQRGLISVPIAFALVGLAVLVAASLTDVTLVAVGLAAGALISVLLRLVLTFRAHQAVLESTRDEALTDPLTGLGNRRALAAALERRLDDDKPAPLLLALFDLDGFKAYNDSFGHAAGDALLVRLARSLRAVLAPPAAVFRMGGDEFCALLPGGDEDSEVLLRAASAVLTDQGDGFAISASLGSVRLPAETDDVEEALRLADQRMYAHKHGVRRAGAAQEVKRALLSALAQRDPELGDHVDDVGELAEQLATGLGMSPAQVERVRIAAELHDIGKMAIPEAILMKPGALSDSEWTLMHQHTVAGERIIAAAPALEDVAPLVRASHERWDGGGYPDALAGERIPVGARVIAVCDSFHAMTSDRPYRQAMSEEVALAELRAGAGTQFDPAVVDAFLVLRGEVASADGRAAEPA